jgi:hypothetical protein
VEELEAVNAEVDPAVASLEYISFDLNTCTPSVHCTPGSSFLIPHRIVAKLLVLPISKGPSLVV